VCEGLLGLLVLLQRMGSNPTIRAALLAFLLGIFPPIKVRHCRKGAAAMMIGRLEAGTADRAQ
jgi:hypothetical protein